MADIKTKAAKSTNNYDHHDIEGVNLEKIDLETVKTVSMPNGNKLVIGRNTESGELQGLRILINKGK